MSKLDEIQYEIYGATRPKHPDGSEMVITPKTRQQIKDLFNIVIESVELTQEQYDELRQKVEAL